MVTQATLYEFFEHVLENREQPKLAEGQTYDLVWDGHGAVRKTTVKILRIENAHVLVESTRGERRWMPRAPFDRNQTSAFCMFAVRRGPTG